MKKLYLTTAAALLMGVSNVHAAGYQLNEYSMTGLGRAFAGMGIMGDDYSAMALNPAGMTANKRSGIQGGMAATQIYSKAKTKYGTDKMDYLVPLPSVLGQYNYNDKLFFGAGVYIPYGLSTKYKHDSHTAMQSMGGVRKSYLEVVDFNFSTAYRFDNGLSLGASAILRWIEGQLTSNLNGTNPYTGQPMNVGYNDYRVNGWSQTLQLGAMYEFDENTRIGLSYRFKSTQKPRGKQYVYLNATGQGVLHLDEFNRYNTMADPELPASWILSGYHKFGEKWGTSASIKYAQWHRFYTFPAHSTAPAQLGNGNYDVNYKWKDVWTFALGEDYYLNKNWTLRFGGAWDQTPAPSNTYRTNRIPDVDRIWASCGFSYMNGNHQFDMGYSHLFMMHGRTRNTNPNDPQSRDMQAKYYSHSNIVGIQYQYKF